MSIPLKDICELIVDCPHSTAPDEGEGYPLIRTPNIGPGYLDLTDVHRVSKEVYDERNARAVPRPNDLILAREAPAGNVGIVPDGQSVCLGQRTVLIRPDQSKVDPQFLNYYLNAPRQRHRLLSSANGATVSHVNMPVIRSLPVDLPERSEQERIAGILGSYDKLIDVNRKQMALLEEAAQRLYKEWFVSLRFPGYESAIINDGVPKGWEVVSLKDTFDFVRGRSYTSKEIDTEEGIKLVNLKNIRAYGGWERNAEKRFDGRYKTEQTVAAGDIVMAVTDMTKERRLVGHVALVPTLIEPAIISMDLIKLIPINVESMWLYAELRFSGLAETIALFANGTNVLHLKPELISTLSVTRPSLEVQEKFAAIAEPLAAEIDCLSEQCEQLAEARNRLLPKLMTGEIEV